MNDLIFFSGLPRGFFLYQWGLECWYWLFHLSPKFMKDGICIFVSPPPFGRGENPLWSLISRPAHEDSCLSYMLRKRTQSINQCWFLRTEFLLSFSSALLGNLPQECQSCISNVDKRGCKCKRRTEQLLGGNWKIIPEKAPFSGTYSIHYSAGTAEFEKDGTWPGWAGG